MKKTPMYEETFVAGAKEPLKVLHQLATSDFVTDYLLYEGNGEVRLVGNVVAKVEVQQDMVRFQYAGDTTEEAAKDPLKQAERFLYTLPLEQWTAYGYVGFDVCKYYYNYSKSSAEPILCMIVPEFELRFTQSGVYVKSVTQQDELIKILESEVDLPTYERYPLKLDYADRENYQQKVQCLIDKIQQRKLHKAILSRSVKVHDQLDPVLTYAEGSNVNNSVRSYCLKLGGTKVVGFSPEILMAVDHERFVLTNPLAGTRPRGDSPERDRQLHDELFTDAKEVKEHALSIWLAQDEIRSVCEPDTVRVLDFMQVKRYRCVQHLSSRVGGTLKADRTSWDALKALLPGITVSGIDKASALEWISQLEEEPRGIYAGAVGWIDSSDRADLAIAIRSVFQYGDVISFQAGAGIMGESNPENEYMETVNKMNTMLSTLVLKHE
ncbi:salicylate synthase [Laceyella sacchari]|uniref:Salicylate synthase n=1 Tax=Laceyella sacchari TaxID=37482 RepID=A0ABY5U0Y4_LACSH|nr:salicylate synthase [Laceyella sacchari]UWE03311.1 salicylate synthase [Laceyella sacchari]